MHFQLDFNNRRGSGSTKSMFISVNGERAFCRVCRQRMSKIIGLLRGTANHWQKVHVTQHRTCKALCHWLQSPQDPLSPTTTVTLNQPAGSTALWVELLYYLCCKDSVTNNSIYRRLCSYLCVSLAFTSTYHVCAYNTRTYMYLTYYVIYIICSCVLLLHTHTVILV